MAEDDDALSFELTDAPSADDRATLLQGLVDHNERTLGPSGRHALAVFLRDGATAAPIRAGLSGYTGWGWLFVEWLWVAEPYRGQGIAGRMLGLAEAEAVKRGCHGAWIDTMNPVALAAYQRAGFAVFGQLDDFPAGKTRYFLKKALG